MKDSASPLGEAQALCPGSASSPRAERQLEGDAHHACETNSKAAAPPAPLDTHAPASKPRGTWRLPASVLPKDKANPTDRPYELAVDALRPYLDIVRVLEVEGLVLHKEGPRFVCRCPFHTERTPSFKVDPIRGLYHCFGCKAGGDVFSYIQKIHNLSFIEAAKYLADLVGFDLSKPEQPAKTPMPKPTHAHASSQPSQAPLRRPEGVQALWDEMKSVLTPDDDGALAAQALLRAKGSDPGDVESLGIARLLPSPKDVEYPSWLPKKYFQVWRLGVPCYAPDGTLSALHFRSILTKVQMKQRGLHPLKDKARWPLGHRGKYSFKGLLMGGQTAQWFLQGKFTKADIEAVRVVEGLTDFVRMSCFIGRRGQRIPVLGMSAGSHTAFASIDWPRGVKLQIFPDQDPSGEGENYAQKVIEQLPGHVEVHICRLQGGSS